MGIFCGASKRRAMNGYLKIGVIIPAITALLVITAAPFCFTMALSGVPQAGLECYCCLAKGNNCTCCLISCPKSNPEAGLERIDWLPDIILSCPDLSFNIQSHTDREEAFFKPGTFYGQVPVKPPNSL
jgi:hypothetical protein